MSDQKDVQLPSPVAARSATTTAAPPSKRSELGAAALTIVLGSLLIDAAAETFLNGAQVRWWVVGVVAAYLGLTAVVWRTSGDRFGWSRHATASFFVLLVLLAATVWLPDGLTNGVAMLRQPTSTLLSIVSAMAVAVAGLMLLRVRFLPWWGRTALGLLALYGVAAFAVGVIEAVPYPNLFQGESLWRRLPYWLQGAFIGTLMVVPLAMVTAIVDAFKHLRAVDGRGWGFQQSLALGLATVMAVSAFTMNGGRVLGVSGPGRAGPQLSAGEITKPLDDTYRELSRVLSGQKEGPVRSPQEAALQLEQLFPALEAAAKEIPRDTFDMAAVVQKVGRDPVKLFEWVRDETYFVPYRGLLRGHTGVLMDRLGNSLDRAVLLYAMLGSIGQTVRLATGELTNEQSRTLLEKVRPVPPDGIPALASPSSDPTEPVLRTYAREHHLDEGTLRQAIAKLSVEQRRVRESVQNRVTQQTAMIAKAIGKPSRNEAEENATRVQAVKEHWWVEWQNGTTWTAFDPSLPDAAPGMTITPAARTASPENLRELGADRLHSIQLRVVVETWNRGQVSEAAVLTRDLLPAELIGKKIALRFVPVAWPRELNLFQEKNPLAKLKETVLAQAEWLPILQIDGQNISRYTFNDYGDFGDMMLPGYAQAALAGRILVHKTEEAVEGLGNRIGGLMGGSKKDPAEPPARKHVTAVWVDYELHVPGQASRNIRRQTFDLIGPAARTVNPVATPRMSDDHLLERGFALMGEMDILLQVSQLSTEFVEQLAAKNLLANRQVLSGLLRDVDSKAKFVSEQASKLSSLPFHLYGLALARREWSRFRSDVYLDSPNILSHQTRLVPNAQGKVLVQERFDIVRNDVTVRPSLGLHPFLVRVEQGVLDTNAEAMLAAASCQRPADSASCGGIHNTAEFFAVSQQERTPWQTIRNSKEEVWQHVEVSMDVRARIQQDLAGGYAVMVPRKTVRTPDQTSTAWWRVDPHSGDTLGIGEDGSGQVAVEYKLGNMAVAGAGMTTMCLLGYLLHEIVNYHDFKPDTPDEVEAKAGAMIVNCVLFSFGSAAGVAFFGTMAGTSLIILLLSGFGAGYLGGKLVNAR